MKDLFILVLVAACVGMFFHDKQQTDDLTKAQADNAQLNDQLTNYQTMYNELVVRDRQAAARQQQEAQQSAPQPRTPLRTDHLQNLGNNPLDRPAY